MEDFHIDITWLKQSSQWALLPEHCRLIGSPSKSGHQTLSDLKIKIIFKKKTTKSIMCLLTSLGARPTKNPLTPISAQTVWTARKRPGYRINSASKNFDNGKKLQELEELPELKNYTKYKSWKNYKDYQNNTERTMHQTWLSSWKLKSCFQHICRVDLSKEAI